MSRRTVQDLALAVGVAAFVALSPLTPPSWGPSLAVGGAVAGGLYFWRRRGRPTGADHAAVHGPRTVVPPDTARGKEQQ